MDQIFNRRPSGRLNIFRVVIGVANAVLDIQLNIDVGISECAASIEKKGTSIQVEALKLQPGIAEPSSFHEKILFFFCFFFFEKRI
jgi:hypothetical protein